MIEFIHSLRVRYSETDKMGFVYHGNYASYFEVARVEMFRSIGISYAEMEDNGVGMPILEQWHKFIKPARYDEKLDIKVSIKETPSARVKFEYEVYNHKKQLTTIGNTTLVFINLENGRPISPPEFIEQNFSTYF